MYHLLLLIGSISTVLASDEDNVSATGGDEMQLNAVGGDLNPDFLVLIPADATLGDLKKKMQEFTSKHSDIFMISHDGKWFEDADDETPLSQLGICDTSDIGYYRTRHLLEGGPGKLELFASTPGVEEFPVIILADATLSDLKEEIKRMTKTHHEMYHGIGLNIDISFGGRWLDKKSDATPVADLGIGPEAKIEYERARRRISQIQYLPRTKERFEKCERNKHKELKKLLNKGHTSDSLDDAFREGQRAIIELEYASGYSVASATDLPKMAKCPYKNTKPQRALRKRWKEGTEDPAAVRESKLQYDVGYQDG